MQNIYFAIVTDAFGIISNYLLKFRFLLNQLKEKEFRRSLSHLLSCIMQWYVYLEMEVESVFVVSQLELRQRRRRQEEEYEQQHPGSTKKKQSYAERYIEDFLPPPEPE